MQITTHPPLPLLPPALLSLCSHQLSSPLITSHLQLRSPMARYSSSSGTMRAVLMLMLLLGAVVAAHGRKVSCENKCLKPIKVNGVTILAKAVVDIEVGNLVEIEVVAVVGVIVGGPYYCPPDVTALAVVYEGGFVKLKVKAAVGLINKLLHTVLGLVLGLFSCKFY